uniref:Small ribosomal subunit protein uS2c n=1 Tax=Floydiella terrestris TaxID=51328 RepID=E2DSI5_FLOTE|nr:ribosomal protein S2 [Floydiella terrestris]ACZ58459.1 ribosomal protein S2 [Floydiella terrestris]
MKKQNLNNTTVGVQNKVLPTLKKEVQQSSFKSNTLRRTKLIKEMRTIIVQKGMLFDNTKNRIDTYKEMLKRNVHYGDKTVTCNPEMKKFTRGKDRGNSFISLFQTRRYLIRALWLLTKYAYQKRPMLFVGTSRPSSRPVATAALNTKSFFVNVRWLGGMLTNWKTMRKLIKKLKKFTKLRQKKAFLNSPKKEIAARKKEIQRLEKYLKGLKMLRTFPQVVIMASQKKEKSAALECQKMGIFNMTIADTDCNPKLADFIIPANDDSSTSIKFLLFYFAKAILIGKLLSKMKKKLKKRIFNKGSKVKVNSSRSFKKN